MPKLHLKLFKPFKPPKLATSTPPQSYSNRKQQILYAVATPDSTKILNPNFKSQRGIARVSGPLEASKITETPLKKLNYCYIAYDVFYMFPFSQYIDPLQLEPSKEPFKPFKSLVMQAAGKSLEDELAKLRKESEEAPALCFCWAVVKGFNLSYRNKETLLFTIDPYYGNLN